MAASSPARSHQSTPLPDQGACDADRRRLRCVRTFLPRHVLEHVRVSRFFRGAQDAASTGRAFGFGTAGRRRGLLRSAGSASVWEGHVQLFTRRWPSTGWSRFDFRCETGQIRFRRRLYRFVARRRHDPLSCTIPAPRSVCDAGCCRGLRPRMERQKSDIRISYSRRGRAATVLHHGAAPRHASGPSRSVNRRMIDFVVYDRQDIQPAGRVTDVSLDFGRSRAARSKLLLSVGRGAENEFKVLTKTSQAAIDASLVASPVSPRDPSERPRRRRARNHRHQK